MVHDHFDGFNVGCWGHHSERTAKYLESMEWQYTRPRNQLSRLGKWVGCSTLLQRRRLLARCALLESTTMWWEHYQDRLYHWPVRLCQSMHVTSYCKALRGTLKGWSNLLEFLISQWHATYVTKLKNLTFYHILCTYFRLAFRYAQWITNRSRCTYFVNNEQREDTLQCPISVGCILL